MGGGNVQRRDGCRPNLDFGSGIIDECERCQLSEGDERATCPWPMTTVCRREAASLRHSTLAVHPVTYEERGWAVET